MDDRGTRAVRCWLFLCAALVLAMVAVGGVTRLTRSGLSIVEWEPVVGALPPLTDGAWAAAFDAYRATPEGRLVNAHLDLAGFQRIFYVEWFHRLLGRVLGLVFLVPLLVFWRRGVLGRARALRLTGWFALGGAQGAMGWFMVKSGLVDVPHVSPYRLTAHLLLALLVFAGLLWEVLRLGPVRPDVRDAPRALAVAARALLVLLVVALAWGGLMAGHRAGLVSDSFPKMSGAWVPPLAEHGVPAWRVPLESLVGVHFTHRVLGVAVVAAALAAAALARRAAGPAARAGAWVLALAALQLGLGALTVWTHVSLAVAVAHQVNGALLLGSAVALAYFAPLRPAHAAVR